MFYDNFNKVCTERNLKPTNVLKAIGKSTGSMGKWKSGSYPQLDVLMLIAEYLEVSIDYLVYGENTKNKSVTLNDEDYEWLEIKSKIPADKRKMCKAFLETHMVNDVGSQSEKNA